MVIWYILRTFGTLCGPLPSLYFHVLVRCTKKNLATLQYFMAIWYMLWQFGTFPPVFGMLHQEKSGNPDYKSIS
jgi:hypothetical protein